MGTSTKKSMPVHVPTGAAISNTAELGAATQLPKMQGVSYVTLKYVPLLAMAVEQ